MDYHSLGPTGVQISPFCSVVFLDNKVGERQYAGRGTGLDQ